MELRWLWKLGAVETPSQPYRDCMTGFPQDSDPSRPLLRGLGLELAVCSLQ